MDEFKVSVIIPVYKAEKYLEKAVESAIVLPEVGEVILIEDNSPDDSLKVCESLEQKDEKVRLFRHPDGQNKGAGASRNLGIKKSSFDFVAFLDADDWYLPNRFKESQKLFEDSSVDGVYEPIGTYFYNEESYMFGKKISKKEGEKIVTFLKEPVEPGNLFYSLLSLNNGNFSTDGITLRRSLIDKVGLFSTQLKLHQDTEYWMRCAYFGSLVAPAKPEVVAIRGVHGENRINEVGFTSKSLFYRSLFERFKREDLKLRERILLYKKYIFFNPDRKYQQAGFIKKYAEVLYLAYKSLMNNSR